MKAFHTRKPKAERRFSGQYAPDGKAKRLAVREAAGHRCIRCGHPFKTGATPPEWSPCDERCTHAGPLMAADPIQGPLFFAGPTVAQVTARHGSCFAQWRVLTVHHFDGDKANDAWWNCLSLCQRCHLEIQCKVDPRIPFFFEHSDWLKPYVAGFYAHKYEGLDLTREEVMARLPELLAYEHKA